MSSKQQLVKLSDGHFMPALGFGTYKPEEVPENKPLEAVNLAIDSGFRHIDTAYVYQTEKNVGQAIRSKIAAGIVKREDVFVTTKLWCTFHRPELVRSNLEKSLKNLQLDYVDLYIIHYPVPMKPGEDLFPEDEHGKPLLDTADICATWEAMEKCKDAGLVKSIGVSNFNRRQLEKILNKPGLKHKPVCNQVECHLYLNQSKLLNYCMTKDIVLVAYCALGSQRPKRWVDPSSPVLLNDPVLCDMAKKHKRSPAQIALRYLLQRGIVVLAQSYKENEIKENLQVPREAVGIRARQCYLSPSSFFSSSSSSSSSSLLSSTSSSSLLSSSSLSLSSSLSSSSPCPHLPLPPPRPPPPPPPPPLPHPSP